MPSRIARSSVGVAKPQSARKKSQKRSLDAFSIASHSVPQSTRVRQHRLGESESAEPRQKRRRLADDEEDEAGEEHASNARRLQKKTVTKRTDPDENDHGSDSEGNEWTMGGQIDDDDDSDLDSDEAFGESDEERFEAFTFRGSSAANKPGKASTAGKKQRKGQPFPVSDGDMDLDEGDEELDEDDEDDFGDEGVDLATMLDDASDDDAMDSKPRPSRLSKDSASDYSSEEDEEDEDTDTSVSDAEPDDADPTKLSKLQDLIASLEDDLPVKRGGSRSTDVHESQQPSDFGLTSSQKLKVSDLLPTITDPALRKSLKVLASDKPSKRSGIPGKLEAPLPKRQQDRLDRTAASQKAKETLDRWRDTVIHNRRAEHLQFPLKDPNASELIGTSKLVATQQEKPQTELESAIQNILEESGFSANKHNDQETRIQEAEELQLNKIPIEEVMARRAELRKARELLFREEVRAKRVKKIKSRSYRRVHRKERERQEEKERDFFDPEGEGMGEDDKERQDRRRAEERMGAKHRESKWAKGMKKSGRTVWDDDARDGVMEMARRNEELRKRIEGRDVRDDDDEGTEPSEDDEDDDEDDSDDAEGSHRKRMQKELDRLSAGDDKQSRLGNMQFMQKADAARKAQNDEAVERMRRELAREDSPSEDEEMSIGRQIFGPKSTEAGPPKSTPRRAELEERPASDEEDEGAEIIVDRPATKTNVQQQRKPKSILKTSRASKLDQRDEAAADSDDPWLTASTKVKKDKKQKEADGYVPPKAALGTVDAAVPAPPKKASQAKKSQSAAPNTDGWITVPNTSSTAEGVAGDEDADSDAQQENPMLSERENQSMYHARAFAGDDVDVDFEAEKTTQTQEEDDKIISNHLPGWGSWAGEGLTKAARKQQARQAHNPLFKTKVEGVRAADRKDASLKNVIISEAQQRKGKKYLASQLPHGFEKRDQYERSLRIPVGPEWTTKEVFQRNTKPRVVVKQGIVAPMEKPLL